MNGTIGLQIHWDPTNGVRNDRLESILGGASGPFHLGEDAG